MSMARCNACGWKTCTCGMSVKTRDEVDAMLRATGVRIVGRAADDELTKLADENDRLRAERDEAIALLRDTTIRGGTCDAIDEEDEDDLIALDDPVWHECSDVDEYQSAKCFTHQLRALLAKLRTP